jgi:aminoglycoside N3'-acetyltransferase
MVRHLPATLWCSAKHYVLRDREGPTGAVDESTFESLLDSYDADAAFVHVGLSDVSSAFEGNAYETLHEHLSGAFESILTPAFTQSFHGTGTFHRKHTEPELGAFARLFFEDADYRTADPLHSIQVQGPYRFEDCTQRDTFAPDGCYARLEADNVLVLNVGTRWLVSTQIHYIERQLDVPYAGSTGVEGVVHHGDGESEHVTQTTYEKNTSISGTD